ncbi:tapasin-like [Narcine bancroftii]|uniref:tapasin-like n=1 Tax=Narcine bancroftii TaxID=1343680 RepID=UPI003832196D
MAAAAYPLALSLLLLTGLSFAADFRQGWVPEVGTLVDCTLVEDAVGKGSSPGSVIQTDTLLLLREVSNRKVKGDPSSERDLPAEVKSAVLLNVFDDSRVIAHPSFRQPRGVRPKPRCEINRYTPQEAAVPWGSQLTKEEKTPAYQSRLWFSTYLQSPDRTFSVTSLHRVLSGPRGEEDAAPYQTSVVLNVFTRTSVVRARLGQDVVLDCGFTLDRTTGFGVEWRYQFQGSGHLVYAYHGPQDRVYAAQEGTELFLDRLHSRGNASLLMRRVDVRSKGTYICTLYISNFQIQQAITLEILEPPKLVLKPDPLYLSPSEAQNILCEVANYYPLDVTVTWTRRIPGNSSAELLPNSWQSGHQQNSDGTFNLTSGITVTPTMADHGTVYTCHVDHVSLKGGVRRSLTLKVAGVSWPSFEEVVGMLICAYFLHGILKLLHYWLLPEGKCLMVGQGWA